jgi:7-carboxy-7-deazaguanine synthase
MFLYHSGSWWRWVDDHSWFIDEYTKSSKKQDTIILTKNELLQQGMLLPLMEEFYSLQGEGHHAGKPAWFIRIGGCDVGCRWCDVKESWNAELHPLTSVDEIVSHAAQCPAKEVVVTGGEPLQYNMDYLCKQMHLYGIKTFLETSGSEKLSGSWNWVCLSPKSNSPPLPEIAMLANELKVIIYDKNDFIWAEKNAADVKHDCKLFLQPEWSHYEQMIHPIVDYILIHPQWTISLQAHKFMRIP